MSHNSDTIWIKNIAHSDYNAFNLFYDKYWDSLLHISIKKTGDIDISMDLVQDLFVDIWQRRSSLPEISSVRNYLVSSLYYKIFMHYRRQGVLQQHVDHYRYFQENDQIEELLTLPEFEDNYEYLLQIIEESVSDMPERMREVFNLKFYRSLNNSEIAERLGISLQTVKNQLSRSLQHIRKDIPQNLPYTTTLVLTTFLLP